MMPISPLLSLGLDWRCHPWHSCWVRQWLRRGSVRRTSIGFGLLIAYVLPGFSVLVAASLVVPALQVWLLGPAQHSSAIGGVLYVTAASILIGQLLNLVRWATLDQAHQLTGLQRPTWKESLLERRREAFELLVENLFRYHQFYGNLAVALPLCWVAFRASAAAVTATWGVIELPLIALEVLLIAGSRDALRRYFSRTQTLLESESAMTNGNHPKPKLSKPQPVAKPKAGSQSK